MEENKTWLDTLYNHPKRDEIIKTYIQSYHPDNDIVIKDVSLISDNNDNVVRVHYNTNVYFNPKYACLFTSHTPLDVYLNIGEYFRYEEHKNIVSIVEPLPKRFKDQQNEKFILMVKENPTYVFNEIGNLCKYHDKNGRGNNTLDLMKVLEALNNGITINGETFNEMLERKNKELMPIEIEKDKENGEDNEKHYNYVFNYYFIDKKKPISFLQKTYGHLINFDYM